MFSPGKSARRGEFSEVLNSSAARPALSRVLKVNDYGAGSFGLAGAAASVVLPSPPPSAD